MLLFTPSSRIQIIKSMSNCMNKKSEFSSSLNSDTTTEHTNKKSILTFHLFDSILSRSSTKPLTINSRDKKSPTRSSSSSCPQSSLISNIQLPEQARCLYNYNAIKEDEISVHRGEYVQILTANQDNRWFVRRNANRTIKGWLPGFVLGLKYPNSTTNNNLTPSTSSNNLNQL
jgi:hypothetical protein